MRLGEREERLEATRRLVALGPRDGEEMIGERLCLLAFTTMKLAAQEDDARLVGVAMAGRRRGIELRLCLCEAAQREQRTDHVAMRHRDVIRMTRHLLEHRERAALRGQGPLVLAEVRAQRGEVAETEGELWMR